MVPGGLFVSCVVALSRYSARVTESISNLCRLFDSMECDYEIVTVVNGPLPGVEVALRDLTAEAGLANVQVVGLAQEVDPDMATWAGVEHCIGDAVIVFDAAFDDPACLPEIVNQIKSGYDVVLVQSPTQKVPLRFRLLQSAYHRLFGWLNGVDLKNDAPRFRGVRRNVVTHSQQFALPSLAFRHLPASPHFRSTTISGGKGASERFALPLIGSVDRGIQTLVAASTAPLRIATSACLLGAFANMFYVLYVFLVFLLKKDMAPGWASLSLQQSGLFFLVSIVLFVFGEYLLHIVRLTHRGPQYHVAYQLQSKLIKHRDRLNIVKGGLDASDPSVALSS